MPIGKCAAAHENVFDIFASIQLDLRVVFLSELTCLDDDAIIVVLEETILDANIAQADHIERGLTVFGQVGVRKPERSDG